MRRVVIYAAFLTCLFMVAGSAAAGGVTPEQIYQPRLQLDHLVGAWELLPDEYPFDEKQGAGHKTRTREMMALRKDGTCRIFSAEHPTGVDGTWTLDDHSMFIKPTNGPRIDRFVYGVRADFMMTRSPIKEGRDQLWARIR